MDNNQKENDLLNFANRLQGVIDKTNAAVEKPGSDGFSVIEYEFKQLKRDFQKFSGQCKPDDQGIFQLSTALRKFETTFNKHSPLKFL